jgi:hypothetical protein
MKNLTDKDSAALAAMLALGLLVSGCGADSPKPKPYLDGFSREMKELSQELLCRDPSRRYAALGKLREYDYGEPYLDISNAVPILVQMLADKSVVTLLPPITIGEEAASVLCQLKNEDARELAFPLIVSLTTNDNPFVRANAAFAFHYKERATRAKPHLLLLSKDQNKRVAKAAQKAMLAFSVLDLPATETNSCHYYSEKDMSWHILDSEGHDSLLHDKMKVGKGVSNED